MCCFCFRVFYSGFRPNSIFRSASLKNNFCASLTAHEQIHHSIPTHSTGAVPLFSATLLVTAGIQHLPCTSCTTVTPPYYGRSVLLKTSTSNVGGCFNNFAHTGNLPSDAFWIQFWRPSILQLAAVLKPCLPL